MKDCPSGKLIREGSPQIKETFEQFIQGGTLKTPIDEQIVYNQLDNSEEAIWSLLPLGDIESMNGYMNRVALHTFSFFDTGKISQTVSQNAFITVLY